jgi:hypothetical protein
MARRIGKILSNQGIITNFEDHHIQGKMVSYMPMDRYDTEWMRIATNILENPEKYEDEEPSILYHETMYESYKPMFFDFKKRLLNILRGTKELPEGKEAVKVEDNSKKEFVIRSLDNSTTIKIISIPFCGVKDEKYMNDIILKISNMKIYFVCYTFDENIDNLNSEQ